MTHKIFISHAHKDKPVADRFVELLILGCGLSSRDITYTSEKATGIPAGTNFINYLVDNLRNSPIVILLLSRNFYNSTFCLSELGATWGLDKPIFPIIIPDLSINEMQDVLQVTQKGHITDKEYLDTLRDVIAHTHKDAMPPTSQWNSKCEQFLRDVPNLIAALPRDSKVDRSVYEELERQYSTTHEELKLKEAEINNLKRSIEHLNTLVITSKADKTSYQALEERLIEATKQLKLKNAEIEKLKRNIEKIKITQETNAVKNTLTIIPSDLEMFQQLVSDVRFSLRGFHEMVKKLIYYKYINASFYAEEEEREEAEMLTRSGYLEQDEFSPRYYEISNKRKSMKDALSKLDTLQDFLSEIDVESNFTLWFENEYDFSPREGLQSEDFWKKHFYDSDQIPF